MLKENEVKFYNQNGYLILKDKLDKKTLSDLKNSTTQLIEEFKKNQSTFIRDKNRNISKPVSYTHLTLPTNSRV